MDDLKSILNPTVMQQNLADQLNVIHSCCKKKMVWNPTPLWMEIRIWIMTFGGEMRSRRNKWWDAGRIMDTDMASGGLALLVSAHMT